MLLFVENKTPNLTLSKEKFIKQTSCLQLQPVENKNTLAYLEKVIQWSSVFLNISGKVLEFREEGHMVGANG